VWLLLILSFSIKIKYHMFLSERESVEKKLKRNSKVLLVELYFHYLNLFQQW
jgi:hypothetical protein